MSREAAKPLQQVIFMPTGFSGLSNRVIEGRIADMMEGTKQQQQALLRKKLPSQQRLVGAAS